MSYYRVHTADMAWLTKKPRGIFTAVGKLVDAKLLTEEEEKEYWKNREYFERVLPVPPFYEQGNPEGAVTWFKDNEKGNEIYQQMTFYRDMCEKYGVKLYTTRSEKVPGRIIYEDEYQIAVVDPKIHISVIIPAHNEEKYIGRCIRSIQRAGKNFKGNIEIIVSCNRCTDRTAEIAITKGATVVYNDYRCIAKVRNDGIEAARGEIIVTIDADNRMTKGTLSEIYRLMRSGKYIGGGAPIRFERYSFPLWCNDLLCRVSFGMTGLYSGIFWAKKETFDAIGGFVDQKAMEDVATAKLLKKYGKAKGLEYTTLRRNFLINSTRKYDDLGDWLYFKLMIKNAGVLLKAAFGDHAGMDQLLDEMFYDYNDR